MTSRVNPNTIRPSRSTPSLPRLPTLRPIGGLTLGGGTTTVSPAPAASSESRHSDTAASSPATSATSSQSQPSTRPKFAPNLAAAGRRQEQTPNTAPNHGQQPPSRQSGSERGRGRGRGNQRGRGTPNVSGARGRGGRNRFEPEIIQSRGIFSEGLAEVESTSRTRDSDADEIRLSRSRPDESKERRKTKDLVKTEAMETDEDALQKLMADNFIAFREDVNRVKPVILPLKSATERKVDRLEDGAMDIIDVKDEDMKSTITSSVPLVEQEPSTIQGLKLAAHIPALSPAFKDLFLTNDVKNCQGNLYFVQLPNILANLASSIAATGTASLTTQQPLIKDEPMDTDTTGTAQSQRVTVKTEPGVETDVQTIAQPDSVVQETKKLSQHCIGEVPQGRIGKLQLMKSGRVRLKLNEDSSGKPLYLDVTPGTKTSFLQQVVNIKTPDQDGDASESGKLYVLGDIHYRLLLTPKIDDLLK